MEKENIIKWVFDTQDVKGKMYIQDFKCELYGATVFKLQYQSSGLETNLLTITFQNTILSLHKSKEDYMGNKLENVPDDISQRSFFIVENSEYTANLKKTSTDYYPDSVMIKHYIIAASIWFDILSTEPPIEWSKKSW